jgi:hypothetical protein
MIRQRFFHQFLVHASARVFAIAMAGTMLGLVLVITAVAFTTPQGRTEQPAQQSQQSGVTSLGPLFEPDLANVKPTDALKSLADKARRDRAECPDALTLKVVLTKGDPLFLETLAKAREEALEQFLEKNYGLKRDRDYKFDQFVTGLKEDVEATYRGPEKPRLNTTSDPPKGTKVKAGDLIEVTMTATDNANASQSGVKSIYLVDLQTNGFVDVKSFDASSKCTATARRPPTFKAQPYKVPPNPPPLVRLEASAEDFAGKLDSDLGVFPTGDWYGTMKLEREIVNTGYKHTITWTFAVSEVSIERQDRDPRGKIIYTEARVRGRAVGQIVYTPTSKFEECTYQHNIQPARFEMEVTGKRQDDRLIIDFPDPGVIDTVRQTCVRGYDETEPRPFNDTVSASFDMSDIKDGARNVIPPIDQNDRVTTTMELYRARKQQRRAHYLSVRGRQARTGSLASWLLTLYAGDFDGIKLNP